MFVLVGFKVYRKKFSRQFNSTVKEKNAMANEIEKFMSATELSKAFGISKSNIFKLARRGVLPKGILIGHSRRWAISDIERVLQGMKGATE